MRYRKIAPISCSAEKEPAVIDSQLEEAPPWHLPLRESVTNNVSALRLSLGLGAIRRSGHELGRRLPTVGVRDRLGIVTESASIDPLTLAWVRLPGRPKFKTAQGILNERLPVHIGCEGFALSGRHFFEDRDELKVFFGRALSQYLMSKVETKSPV